jgi:vanillate O-demethylase monooxygenase subunit
MQNGLTDQTEMDGEIAVQKVDGQRFIREAWYVAALSTKVSREPSQAWILGEPVVLFRKLNGAVVALRDRCPHRLAPLSLGRMIGDAIQCRYHGFQFDCEGACTTIPGETVIPSSVAVGAFPVIESLGFVWVWPGDSSKADEGRLPPFPWPERPGFLTHNISRVFEVPFGMIIDNLMDLTHVHFVHSILGAGNLVHESEAMETWEEGDRVRYRRRLKKGAFAQHGRYMEIGGEYIPASLVTTSGVPRQEGTDDVAPGPISQVLHCLTPLTERSTGYFAIKCWNAHDQPHRPIDIIHQMNVTLDEDQEIIEAQFKNRQVTLSAELGERLVRADRAAVMARRVYERLQRREVEMSGAPAQDAVPVSG